MKKNILSVIFLLLVLFTLTGCNNSENNIITPDGAVRTELTVWGMTCGACIQRVTNIIQ